VLGERNRTLGRLTQSAPRAPILDSKERGLVRNVTIGASRLELVEGDITAQDTEAISTGAYGYPLAEAARIALTTVADSLRAHPGIALVRFVLFGEHALRAYEAALAEFVPGSIPGEP
jgi:hypothetical protein